MRGVLPENGYESPRSPDDDKLFGQGIHNGERRRNGRTKSSDNPDEVGSPESKAYLNGAAGTAEHKLDEEARGKTKRKVGLRDRVGCFTWTWFTMTMATGGIANVIHSSNAIHTFWPKYSSALTKCSSIHLRRVDYYWHHILYFQSCVISHECNFDYFTVQVESRLLPWFLHKPIRVSVHSCLRKYNF